MTQIDQVRRHLEAGKTITPATAIAVYGIFRLASVIEDLRLKGMTIDTVLKRDEMGKLYATYRLRQPIAVGTPVQVKPGHGIGLPSWVRTLREAHVVTLVKDAALVEFRRGQNVTRRWLNEQELVRAL